MNPTIEYITQKEIEFRVLTLIVGNYFNLPIEFCLSEFLGWDSTKIKTFTKALNKEKRKAEKSREKQRKISVH